jgi:hypothetical protein
MFRECPEWCSQVHHSPLTMLDCFHERACKAIAQRRVPDIGMSYPTPNQVYGGGFANAAGVSGSGILGYFTFRGISGGTTSLQFARSDLYDFNLDPLPAPTVLSTGVTVFHHVYTWTGSVSSSWIDNFNWLPNTVPTLYDVMVPGSIVVNWPSVSTVSMVHNFTVQTGAQITLTSGAVLNVEGAVTNNGALPEIKNVSSGTTTEFLHLRNAVGTADKYRGVDITPSSNMGLTSVTIKGNQTHCTTNPADELLTRCYNITPGTATNATLRFWYTEAERNNQTANALRLWHYAPWAQVGTPYTYSESTTTCSSGPFCWMQAVNVSSYSPFGVGRGAAPTAITLKDFSAVQEPGASGA